MGNYVPKARCRYDDIMKLIHDEYNRLKKKREANPFYQPRNYRIWRIEFDDGTVQKLFHMQGIEPNEFLYRASWAWTTVTPHGKSPLEITRMAGPFKTHEAYANFKFPEDRCIT